MGPCHRHVRYTLVNFLVLQSFMWWRVELYSLVKTQGNVEKYLFATGRREEVRQALWFVLPVQAPQPKLLASPRAVVFLPFRKNRDPLLRRARGGKDKDGTTAPIPPTGCCAPRYLLGAKTRCGFELMLVMAYCETSNPSPC